MTAKPNILIILSDDIGVDAFRIDKAAKTVTAHLVGPTPERSAGPAFLPTFERMLRSGVHFEQAWAHPVCTPTRASLWTGMQPWRTTLGYPLGGDLLPTNRGLTSLAQALKAGGSGYRCAMFGKWDLGGVRDPADPAKDQNPVKTWGWDHFEGIYRGGLRGDGTRDYRFSSQDRVTWERLNGTDGNPSPEILAKRKAAADALRARYPLELLQNNPDLRFYIWEKDVVGPAPDHRTAAKRQPPSERQFLYATEDQVEGAKKWLAANRTLGPWCIALNLITPHDPFHVPPPGTYGVTTIKDPTRPTVQEMVVAMLESMDHYVGELVEAIGDQLANTVILFVGDNGTQDRDVDTHESVDAVVGDDKGTDAIGGIHVPMIVADGGVMAGKQPCFVANPRRSVASPVHIIDVYDTVLDIAGVTNKPTNDSTSMVPHLRGAAGNERTHNFSQMYAPWRLRPGHADKYECPGISASASDGAYKLTCRVLRKEHGHEDWLYLVDLAGNPSPTPYFEYVLAQLRPDAAIPGALVEQPIDAIARNPDGTSFSITQPTYAAKIMELHGVLAQHYLDASQRPFPPITPGVVPTRGLGVLETAVGADGRISVFVIDGSRTPWVRTQTQKNGPSYGGWRDLGSKVNQRSAALDKATGTLRLFGIGTDGALWVTSQREPGGSAFTPWESLGGGITQLVAATHADGRIEVFAIGTDGALWHKGQTAPGSRTFGDWASRGGVVKQITVARNADGRLEVFGIGSDDGLWHLHQTQPSAGTWSGWQGRGGVVKQIVAESNADGRIEVFGIGSDNALWHIWQASPSSGTWSGWASLGGVVKRIGAARNADGRITAFGIGTDDAIWTMSQTAPSNGWGGWQSIGGRVTQPFTVEANADGRLAVFGIGSELAVWTTVQAAPSSGTWSPWAKLDDAASAPSPASGFGLAGTRWSVGVMDDNGTVSAPHPTPWEFGAGTMQAPPHWTGTYAPLPGQPDAYACRITMTSGGAVDEFQAHFVSPTRFLCTKNGALYRFGKKL